ncbi:hypothetical protein D3C84_1098930 [compost metagenome]
MGARQVGRPDGCSQPVRRVVGDAHRILGFVEFDHRQHRAENLFPGNCHRVADIVEQCRLHVAAAGLLQCHAPSQQQLGALILSLPNVLQHPFQVARVHQRTDIGVGIQRMAWLPAF